MALPADIRDREHRKFTEISGEPAVRVSLESDVQIGAIEVKDATTDTRAKVKTDGTDNALVVVQNTVPTTPVTGTFWQATQPVSIVTMPTTPVTGEVSSNLYGWNLFGFGSWEKVNSTIDSVGNQALVTTIKDNVPVMITDPNDSAQVNVQNMNSDITSLSSAYASLSKSCLYGRTTLGTSFAPIEQSNNTLHTLIRAESPQESNSIRSLTTAKLFTNSTMWAGEDYGLFALGISDANFYPYGMFFDENGLGLYSQPVDTNSNKLTFHNTDYSSLVSSDDRMVLIGGKDYTGTYNYPLVMDDFTGILLVQPMDVSSNKQVFTATGEVKVENLTACNTGAVAGDVSVTILKPDGTNTMPSGDADARAISVNLGINNDVTVTSGAITETNSGAIKTAVEIIDNAISGNEMQVDVVASLPAGDNQLGGVVIFGGDGTSADTSITLTLQSTSYSVPAAAPNKPYVLNVYNVSDTDVFWRYTDGTTVGMLIAAGEQASWKIGANKGLYFHCPTAAGKIINVSSREDY